MSIPSAFLANLHRMLGQIEIPIWMVNEVQNRIVLAINHVLQQEPLAMERLKRQQGKTIQLALAPWTIRVRATPAGLLEVETLAGEAAADLSLMVSDALPLVMEKLARQEKPSLHIAGDVQLAAEINWMIEHVRWDYEEDLSRIVGDVFAHQIAQALRQGWVQLQVFIKPVAAH